MTARSFIPLSLVALLCLGAFKGINAQQCTLYTYLNCVLPPLNRLGTAQVSEATMDSVCSSLGDIESCVTNGGCSTNEPVMIEWRGQKAAFNYICNDGRQAYISGAPCFNTESVGSAILQCKYSFIRGARSNFCGSLNGFQSCCENAVSHCGQQTSSMWSNYFNRLLTPAASFGRCTLSAPGQIVARRTARDVDSAEHQKQRFLYDSDDTDESEDDAAGAPLSAVVAGGPILNRFFK